MFVLDVLCSNLLNGQFRPYRVSRILLFVFTMLKKISLKHQSSDYYWTKSTSNARMIFSLYLCITKPPDSYVDSLLTCMFYS